MAQSGNYEVLPLAEEPRVAHDEAAPTSNAAAALEHAQLELKLGQRDELLQRARRLERSGRTNLIIGGIALGVGTLFVVPTSITLVRIGMRDCEEFGDCFGDGIGSVFAWTGFTFGALFVAAGIPLMIVGAKKKSRANKMYDEASRIHLSVAPIFHHHASGGALRLQF